MFLLSNFEENFLIYPLNKTKFPYFSNPKLINSKNDNLYKI